MLARVFADFDPPLDDRWMHLHAPQGVVFTLTNGKEFMFWENLTLAWPWLNV